MDFVLEEKDYVGEEAGKALYASIKDKLELVNTIKFPADFTVSKSFIRGIQDYRDENFEFIFFCNNEEQEKQLREDQKFLEDCRGCKLIDLQWNAKRRHKNASKNNHTI